MLAYYGTEISPNQTETTEGYLICRNVPIARTGPMEYTARELKLEGVDPDQLVTVNRHPEDVFSPAALASFEGKPVTDTHPPEDVGPENYAAYERGHAQNVRQSGDFVVADLYIKDPNLISDVRNGVKRQVSCGYNFSRRPDGSAYKQTEIRGNHVAVVPQGRAGETVSIKDTATEAEKGTKLMSKKTKTLLSWFSLAAKDATPEAMEKLTNDAAAMLEDEPPKADPAPAADVMVERAPKGDDLGSKLDELLGLVREMLKAERQEEKAADEGDLDKMIQQLSGGEQLPEGGDPEKAVTIPAEKMEDADPQARDAALQLLKKVRPAVAAIKDKTERARVVDALLSTVKGPNIMAEVMTAAQGAAQKATDANTSYEGACKAQKAEYDARNPHKKKEA